MVLAEQYFALVDALDASFLEDGADVGPDGARARCAGGGELLSLWRSNTAVVKNHLLEMFCSLKSPDHFLFSRLTFRHATSVRDVIAFFRRRFTQAETILMDNGEREDDATGALGDFFNL